jgi:single-stranded DNA-binding protein
MSSTRLSLNRCVLAGRAVADPITKQVTSRHGDTTLTTFSIRTPNDTYVGSVIIEVQAWSRAATVAQHITKGRTVAVDGQLTQHEYLGSDGKKQTRTSLRADRVQLIDDVETPEVVRSEQT